MLTGPKPLLYLRYRIGCRNTELRTRAAEHNKVSSLGGVGTFQLPGVRSVRQCLTRQHRMGFPNSLRPRWRVGLPDSGPLGPCGIHSLNNGYCNYPRFIEQLVNGSRNYEPGVRAVNTIWKSWSSIPQNVANPSRGVCNALRSMRMVG